MARVPEQFAEEVHCMKVLHQEYTRRNDVDDMALIDQEVKDIFQICSTAEKDVRQTIKSLSKEIQELETIAAYPYREGQHAERVAALQRQIDLAKSVINEMDAQARAAELECEEVNACMRAATAAATEAAAASNSAVANLKGQLAMYKHITNVTWWQGKETISGTVSDTKTGDIRVFDYPKDMDKFELVNKLWETL